MAQISTNEFKSGVKIEIEGQPYTIVSTEFVKPGKGQAFNRVRVRHLMTGRVIEKTIKSGEKFEVADIAEMPMRLLYKEADGYVFMSDTTFEQVKVDSNKMEDVTMWMLDDLVYEIIFYKGEPVAVEPPVFMEMKIVQTDPGLRGDSSGRVLKAAILESGAKVQVPIFIEQDEKIRIDTRTGEYVSRVN